MELTIKNMTPHSITFVGADNAPLMTVEPSGTLARVSTRTETVGTMGGLPVTKTVFGEVEGLPEREEGTIFIVSSLVAGRVPEREDVLIPNESVRDEKGRIIGCRSLGRI